MVGERIAKLRAAHGESLREAAHRTGVSHTTIARIEKGEVTGSFHATVRKIAEGYGVRVEYLLTGREPGREFESAIRGLPPEERTRLYFASPRARTKMVLDFLSNEYRDEISLEDLLQPVALDGISIQELLDNWDTREIPEETYRQVAEVLSRITGITLHWFYSGILDGDIPLQISPATLASYLEVIKKAAQHGVDPFLLDMAVDLLILKTRDAAPALPWRQSSKP